MINSCMVLYVKLALYASVILGLLGCSTDKPISQINNERPSSSVSSDLEMDNVGRKLKFKGSPRRVITTSESAAELLLRLGVSCEIVGIYYQTSTQIPGEFHEALSKIPRLSTNAPPSKEKVLALNPDFVLAHFPTVDLDPSRGGPSIEDYEAIGANVFGFRSTSERPDQAKYEGFLQDVEDLGRIFGVTERAMGLTSDLRQRIAAVRRKVEGHPRVSTTICFSASDQMLGVFGSGVLNDLVEAAGGDNVYSGSKDSLVNASREDFALKTIDCYVIVDMTHVPTLRADKTAAWLFSTFPHISASKYKRFVGIDMQKMNLGIGSVEALEEMAKAFHPELFGAKQ